MRENWMYDSPAAHGEFVLSRKAEGKPGCAMEAAAGLLADARRRLRRLPFRVSAAVTMETDSAFNLVNSDVTVWLRVRWCALKEDL